MSEPFFYWYVAAGKPEDAVAYIVGGHPGYALKKGVPIDDWPLRHFEIGNFDERTGRRTTIPGRLTGFLNNDAGWLLVNRKVREVLAEAGIGARQVQWLDVCVHHDGSEQVGEYFAANILDRRKAVHPERSRYAGGIPAVIVLRKEAVHDAHFFGLQERSTRVYFSPRLRRLLDRAGVTGVHWERSSVA